MAKKKGGYGQLTAKLYSQFHVYFEGGAESVTAQNDTGPFDILPGHANFFTLLTEGKVVIMSGGEPFEYEVTRGVIQVYDNDVKVFVDI